MSDCFNPKTWIDVIGVPIGLVILFAGWLPVLSFAMAIEKIGNAKADAIKRKSEYEHGDQS